MSLANAARPIASADKRATYLSLPALDLRQRYTIPEASLYLRQSVAKTYLEIAAGRLKVLKSGSRSYVHGTEIARASTASVI
jgi:hypothetical protein